MEEEEGEVARPNFRSFDVKVLICVLDVPSVDFFYLLYTSLLVYSLWS